MDEKNVEDTTKYGEFVPSNYHWLPLDEQKRKAKKIENITKNEKNTKWKKIKEKQSKCKIK